MNFALSLILGSVICAAICQSYLAVGTSPTDDYWGRLAAQIPAPKKEPEKVSEGNYQTRDSLEKNLWANERLEECRNMLTEDYLFYGAKDSPLYIKRFRERAEMLASVDIDLFALQYALDIYKAVLVRDSAYTPEGKNVFVDHSNMGRCYQLLAETSDDVKVRKQNFQLALSELKIAGAGFQKLNDKEASFNCLTNQYSLLHAMQEKGQAREIFKELRQIKTSMPQNLFRELVLEQQ